MPRPPISESRLRFLGRYRMFSSTTALVLGFVIIYRGLTEGATLAYTILGAAMFGLGLYRWNLFWRVRTSRARR